MIYMTIATRKPFQKDLLTCSFQGFREKAIAVAKAAEEFLTNARGSSARVSNAGNFYGVSKYGANEDARDETKVVHN